MGRPMQRGKGEGEGRPINSKAVHGESVSGEKKGLGERERGGVRREEKVHKENLQGR